MRKTVLTILAASLIVGSAVQTAGAAERSHKSDRARVHTTEQFRNANNSLAAPSVGQQNLSDYSEGHVISAPAGQ
jgi:hypothetical protein